ncbi:hypothetical protein N7447_004110 [Penicillium robsamsonii]|uniref:uncharacterized protein n=1 Tax=Penicillium robsamsonii TaxID=1792511 RepID=UPI002546B08C|nr:uncharacterized protein N7447_004110 [Penicillium robsamsonii]KAJ5827347.1 hypothetical protein N7447_004110 [Penicillium robsamsonii]
MSIMGYSDLCLGTEATFITPSPQKWVLEEKLTENFQRITSRELQMGGGPSFAVFKYLCYSATDSSKKAFMRIYFQIPNPGTESQLPRLRQQQAAPSRKHLELQALKDLSKQYCTVVPALLAYKEGKQGKDGVVPDGYITHIMWEMVSGKPLDTDQFWGPESARLREAVRTKFRHIWEYVYRIPSSVLKVKLTNLGELKHHGWYPGLPLLQKIIYDEHIAGFRDPDRFDPGEKFSNMTFVHWRLTRPPRKSGWEKDPSKWSW